MYRSSAGLVLICVETLIRFALGSLLHSKPRLIMPTTALERRHRRIQVWSTATSTSTTRTTTTTSTPADDVRQCRYSPSCQSLGLVWVDVTGGDACYWRCARNCPGGSYATKDCKCACQVRTWTSTTSTRIVTETTTRGTTARPLPTTSTSTRNATTAAMLNRGISGPPASAASEDDMSAVAVVGIIFGLFVALGTIALVVGINVAVHVFGVGKGRTHEIGSVPTGASLNYTHAGPHEYRFELPGWIHRRPQTPAVNTLQVRPAQSMPSTAFADHHHVQDPALATRVRSLERPQQNPKVLRDSPTHVKAPSGPSHSQRKVAPSPQSLSPTASQSPSPTADQQRLGARGFPAPPRAMF